MASARKEAVSRRVELLTKVKATATEWSINDDKAVLKETGYELIKKIGHGSFAKVWKARSFRLKKDVAVKIIAKPQASTEYVEKFLPRELSIIQNLKHKNLIKFFEVIETWHSVYIVMELADKGTISDLIEKKKCIPEAQAKKYFLQLLDVVEYCHLKGVVHRDIKCENLLLDREGNLLLTDFGFAKQDVFPLLGGRFRMSKTYCGSYAYAPPEVLANRPYNPCLADVWCMGMVLYTMLFGVLPYKHANMKGLIALKRRPPQFPEIPYVSSRAKRFLLQMLTLESARADIIKLRMNPWLIVPKVHPMKKFSWLPGIRSSQPSVEEVLVLQELSAPSFTTLSSLELLGLADKSTTVNVSEKMNQTPLELSIESCSTTSGSGPTVLTGKMP